jgi:two-component system chemotaxis response regulator CheB
VGQNGSRRDIIVVGGSSGALPALKFIADLPSELPAAIFLVLHLAPNGPGLLPRIIRTYSKIPVEHAQDGEPIAPGRVYVARPDYHLSLREGFVQLARGPKENRHRPSIDVLFCSAAMSYGRRVVGVILSGMLDDGSAGLVQVRACGGLAIVQDPKDALFPDMPRNALIHAGADHCVSQSQLPGLLIQTVTEAVETGTLKGVRPATSRAKQVSVRGGNNNDDHPATPANFSCPDCGGGLQRTNDSNMLQFRCRVGHALSGQSLLAAQSGKVEEALWTALRALEEKAELVHKLKDDAIARNFKSTAEKLDQEAKKLDADASVIRSLLKSTDASPV